MEQLKEERRKQYERYVQQRQKEIQQHADEENEHLQNKENVKNKLRKLGNRIHNYQHLNDLANNLENFEELLEKNFHIFEDYDFNDIVEIFQNILNQMQNSIIKFRTTSNLDKNNTQKIQKNILKILELLKLPENFIDFDVQMDTTDDENFAKQLLTTEIPKNELPKFIADSLSNIYLCYN